jgi:hypothetical protein
LFATIAGEIAFTNLTPASGRQDHTASPSASAPFVIGAISVHRIPPRVRDDREPPPLWDETVKHMQVIWVKSEPEYFCKRGWTGKPLICPSGAKRTNMDRSAVLDRTRGFHEPRRPW